MSAEADAPLVAVDDLVFDYDTVRALDGISLAVEPGMVIALVGPNGAGKTTLMRCIAALETPTSGLVRVDGIDVRDDPREVHRRIGYLPDFFGLYDELTVAQALDFHAAAKKVPADERRQRVDWAAALLGIAAMLKRPISELSRGNRQKVAIAQALVHRPKLMLLDEPASGLDPEARRDLSATIRALAGDGATLIVSSHILGELEDYSTHALVLREGRIEAFHAIDPAAAGEEVTQVRIRLAHDDARLAAIADGLDGVTMVETDGTAAVVAVAGDVAARQRVLRALVEAGLPVAEFAPQTRSVSDIYFPPSGPAPGTTP